MGPEQTRGDWHLLVGHDAVINGSRFQTSDAAALVSALKQADVKRLLVVGGAGSLEVAPAKAALMDTPGFPDAMQAHRSTHSTHAVA